MSPSRPAQHARATLARRAAGLITAAVLLLTPSAAEAAGSIKIPAEQTVVKLLINKDVSAKPVYGSKPLTAVADQRPITLTTTTLPVLATRTDEAGRVWLKVRLPGRVLGRKAPPRTGWITATYTKITTTPWHLVVNVNKRQVTAYKDGRRKRTFSAIVGKSSTPTPRGEYFVEETMHLPSNFPGAPYAIAASARSRVLTEFMGGPGQIAVHGIQNAGGQMGTAVSHGCVRVSTAAIKWLARYIKAGTPLTIR